MIRPTHSNVLLRRLPSTTRFDNRERLIVILDQILVHDSFECQVLAVGPGEILGNGTREPLDIEPGDHVLVFQDVGTVVNERDRLEFLVDISAIDAKVAIE